MKTLNASTPSLFPKTHKQTKPKQNKENKKLFNTTISHSAFSLKNTPTKLPSWVVWKYNSWLYYQMRFSMIHSKIKMIWYISLWYISLVNLKSGSYIQSIT